MKSIVWLIYNLYVISTNMERERSQKQGMDIKRLINLPEYIAIGVGGVLLLLSPFAPPLMPIAGELIVGGGTSLGITDAVVPDKKERT
jgi:hypothetical protein